MEGMNAEKRSWDSRILISKGKIYIFRRAVRRENRAPGRTDLQGKPTTLLRKDRTGKKCHVILAAQEGKLSAFRERGECRGKR